jgi:hypothetical protein
MILQPHCEVNRFGPEILWQISLVQNGTHVFHEAMIERFGNAVMLRHIMCSYAAFSALLLKISSEFVTGVLTAMIRT